MLAGREVGRRSKQGQLTNKKQAGPRESSSYVMELTNRIASQPTTLNILSLILTWLEPNLGRVKARSIRYYEDEDEDEDEDGC